MLEDRDYMREQSGGFPWSMTAVLAAALTVVFCLQCIDDAYLQTRAVLWLALTPECLRHGWIWQLVTFQLLHASLWHLAGNLIVFWWAGHFVEHVMGKAKLVVALFACGAIGGLLQAILMLLFPMRFNSVVLGASAGVAGLFAIFALLQRESTVRLWFVLPIRAITLLWALGIISLFFTIVPNPRESIAHAAHLGGLLAGVAWVKLGWHRDYVQLPWEGWLDRWRRWSPLQTRRRRRELVKAAAVRLSSWPPGQADPVGNLPSEEFISREVDPILDKISEHGIQSLTERERKILEAARNKMAKR
jgi:membrane associated rhomboid family serine protease